jgi:hypothetical protein
VNESSADTKILYLIHAASDFALAAFLKYEVERQIPMWRVFVASKAGQIPTGSEWLNEIQRNLTDAAAYLLLLTPASVERRWVWYEAGAAWKSGKLRLPVVAAGLDRATIDFPLKSVQTLMLANPEEASQLFTDLGGHLESPSAFCSQVTQLQHVTAGSTITSARRQEINESIGRLGDPPKRLLRLMLAKGSATRPEMKLALEEPPHYVSDPISIEKMIQTLKASDLVQGSAEDRWRVTPELDGLLRQHLKPSAFAVKIRELAKDLRTSVEGQSGLIDGNLFEQQFRDRLTVLRDKAARDHGVTAPWLDKLPSNASSIRKIADALDRLAQEVG